MMYPFMTLDDETEIVHSELKEDGTIKVYIIKTIESRSSEIIDKWYSYFNEIKYIC